MLCDGTYYQKHKHYEQIIKIIEESLKTQKKQSQLASRKIYFSTLKKSPYYRNQFLPPSQKFQIQQLHNYNYPSKQQSNPFSIKTTIVQHNHIPTQPSSILFKWAR
eukprot:EC095105.1.p2 GENE.EC095105.1~~EC095105.1.p2  ORF type:complete len:106 (-),score=17.09 EC095105.1:23-340(-)